MKQIYIWIVLIIIPFQLLSQFKLENQKINMQQNCNLISKGNNLILYGLYMTNQGYSFYPINLFDGNKWSLIPSYFENDNQIDTLQFNKSNSSIVFGNNSDIWICGQTNGFYKWNGNNFQKYFLDDNLKSIREYISIGMDSTGNIWLTTNIILAHDPPYINYYTELIKYDGQSFEIVTDNKSFNKLGFSSIFVSSKNKIFVTSTSIDNNLLIIDDSGSMKITTIPTPHKVYNPEEYEQRLVDVISIFEDKVNNIWFGLGESSPRDPGLVVLKNDDTWGVYTEHNTYPMRSTLFSGFKDRDSVFSVCSAITEDRNGSIWVGGTGFLSLINNDDMLVTPDVEDFLSESTFFSSILITDIGKDAPPEHVKFLNSSDSIMSIILELFRRDWTTQHTLGKIGESGGRVESMTTTDDGSLWIAFYGIGLLRYHPSITNIKDISNSKELNLYPQLLTSSDKLINIAFDKPQNVSTIKIFNLSGKQLMNKQYNAQITGIIEMKIDDKNFIAGTYFAAIELKDRTIFRKFLIN